MRIDIFREIHAQFSLKLNYGVNKNAILIPLMKKMMGPVSDIVRRLQSLLNDSLILFSLILFKKKAQTDKDSNLFLQEYVIHF